MTEVLPDMRRPTRSASDQRHVVALLYTLSRDTTYHQLWQGISDEEQRYADQQPKQEERDCQRAITALKRLGYDVTVKRVA